MKKPVFGIFTIGLCAMIAVLAVTVSPGYAQRGGGGGGSHGGGAMSGGGGSWGGGGGWHARRDARLRAPRPARGA